MSPKQILITGGTGFIGSHLTAHLLKKGWNVTVLDNCCFGNKLDFNLLQQVTFHQEDVRNLQAVLEASEGCDTIVHLAALVGVDEVIAKPTETIEVEIQGVQNVVKAAKKNGVKKIIYTSSSAVYKNTIHEYSKESDALALVNDYAVAKRMNEVYLQAITNSTGISTNSLRLFNVYGTHQDTRMVIPRFFQQAQLGIPIQVFGDGQQIRDFTHVEDVIAIMEKMIKRKNITGIFNVARGQATTILQLAQLIKSVTQSDSPIELLDFPEERLEYKVNKRVGSPEKLWKQLRVKPTTSIREGLIRLTHQIENLNIQKV